MNKAKDLVNHGICDISDGLVPIDLELMDSEEEHGEEPDRLHGFPEDGEIEVTSVEVIKRPKNRFLIRFGEISVTVHEDILIKYRMTKGSLFTKKDLSNIIIADERQIAYVESLSYLSRKPRTALEIHRKLNEKGCEEQAIMETLQRLIKEGLIDDAMYAQEWANQRVRSRGKGKLWVRQELRQKGVSKPLIEEALSNVSEEDEYSSALALGRKKWRQTHGEPTDRKRKTGAFLLRRGYSSSLSSKVIRELLEEDSILLEEDEDYGHST
ncbi:regulatory protein [Paenibacillus shirakamiensis]|uniref:Regulatory protein RecX n=1 Tax=Paenibacillus shirakamiensis TaxID=1265935 RepID=A0ABS4JKB9_9BACL|nr:RecX family transcriptional regulator [Paenibacillus shirakamiensis]MBP2001044.1 regulatory protein [Paenibacillus shirakamiensis]